MRADELDEKAARRLAVIKHAQEVTGNITATCQHYGISRQVFYNWLHRYEAGGLTGLRDREPPAPRFGRSYRYWEPTKWWRVLTPTGHLWCETSDEDEAIESMRPGDQLQNLWTRNLQEWRPMTVSKAN
jgi:transposase-like protein